MKPRPTPGAGRPADRGAAPPRHASQRLALTWLCAAALAGCGTSPGLPGDNAPTLVQLLVAPPLVPVDPGQPVDEAGAIAAYQAVLDHARQPGAETVLTPQLPLALRRLGDLAMDQADRRAADAAVPADPDYGVAIERYLSLLQAHPTHRGNHAVLYQLARAQEQAGQMDAALATLTQLVSQHADSPYTEEAQFRRGEMLFALGRYAQAEAAYATVLALQPMGGSGAEAASVYAQRAPYMLGWSRFKQGAMDSALPPLFTVLDQFLTLHAEATAPLAELPALTRAQRELLEDTLRVSSIALAQEEGAARIAALADSPPRQAWQWRVFDALASLYQAQDRPKDAADTLDLFARQQALHAQAPVLLSRVVQIHEQAGFTSLALRAKTQYVERYGLDSAFRHANPAGWQAAQPLVRTHLEALARHFHALSQQPATTAPPSAAPAAATPGHAQAEARGQALHWYGQWLQAYPQHPRTPALRFLQAELLVEDHRHAAAAQAYEAVAYGDGAAAAAHADAATRAEAGYAALLAHAQLVNAASDDTTRQAAQQATADSARRFAQTFADDPRRAAVLVDRADRLFALAQPEAAAQAAQQALRSTPPASGPEALSPAQRRTAHTVLAHTAFERGALAEAEAAYAQALALAADLPAAQRAGLVERQTLAAVRQGESAREAGQLRAAWAHFQRAADLAGASSAAAQGPLAALRVAAQFDAATTLVRLQDWAAAAPALEAFRQHHGGHPLQAELPAQLAVVYLGQQRWALAAAEFDRIAATSADTAVARSARWQAAELMEQALAAAADPPLQPTRPQAREARNPARARRTAALPPLPPAAAASTQAWERYLAAHPQPLEPALQARLRLAAVLTAHGRPAEALAQQQQVLDSERSAGSARTAHSRQLAGQAALALAEPVAAAYRSVALVEPLARQLKRKQAALQAALSAYTQAAETADADSTTAASFHSAALYQDFGRALLQSPRPGKLTALQREQYDVMLEEQAFPFEDKAIALHQSNTARAAAGLWGPWIARSYAALATLMPARYGKTEQRPASDHPALSQALADHGAGRLPQAITLLEAAVVERPDPDPDLLTHLGLLYREAGRFADAQRRYEAALSNRPDHPAALHNLAVLFDLYLDDPARALPLYQRCLALASATAPGAAGTAAEDTRTYTRWVAEVQRRQPAPAKAAASATGIDTPTSAQASSTARASTQP